MFGVWGLRSALGSRVLGFRLAFTGFKELFLGSYNGLRN